MAGESESAFVFAVEPQTLSVEELGERLWDFAKKASRSLYDQFTGQLGRHDIQLTRKGQVVLTRQLLIINMWSICKAWMEAEDGLELMHQEYLKGVSLFFDESAKQEEVWAFAKKELMERYKAYYAYWMNNDPNVSADKIVGLATSMLKEMLQHEDLVLGGKYQSILINHLKIVLKALLKMKQEYTINL